MKSNAGAVLKALKNGASAFPDRSVTPLVANTVIVSSSGSAIDRKTIRLSVDRLMLGDSRVDPAKSATVVVVTVFGLTASEKVSETVSYGPTSVAPFVGVTLRTVGPFVSGTFAVVNSRTGWAAATRPCPGWCYCSLCTTGSLSSPGTFP